MYLTRQVRVTLGVISAIVLAFLYAPLVLVVLNSFNSSRTFAFPPNGLTLKWWRATAHSSGALDALWKIGRASCRERV